MSNTYRVLCVMPKSYGYSYISEVMNELGFVNRTYFYRIFFEDTGITPGEFKRRGHAY